MQNATFMLTVLMCCTIHAEIKLKSTGVTRFDAVLTRAVSYLESIPVRSPREQSLVAYALQKAGATSRHPLVATGVAAALRRSDANTYATPGYDHIYLAGVDAMLLSAFGDEHQVSIQRIADYVCAAQRSDGSWSDALNEAGDSSMSQYGMLALWAASRSGCQVDPVVLDRAASFYLRNRNSDGGWGYRPGTSDGPGKGETVPNMVLAGAGSLAIARLLLHGEPADKKEHSTSRGPLVRVTSESPYKDSMPAFPNYRPEHSRQELTSAIDTAMAWLNRRRQPISQAAHRIYFYYSLERAAALTLPDDAWFEFYGDGLASLQAKKGEFQTHSSPHIGTSFAVLYYVRSTKQITQPAIGNGTLIGQHGLKNLFGSKTRGERQSLDILLDSVESELSDLKGRVSDQRDRELAAALQYASAEELTGQMTRIRMYLASRDPALRANACYALSRTGHLVDVPLLLTALRDPSPGVNARAMEGLRFLSRKPHGFGLPPAPDLSKSPTHLQGQHWQQEASRRWMQWYQSVRPFDEQDGLDELAAP